jgi:signal transduction histidine kinase
MVLPQKGKERGIAAGTMNDQDLNELRKAFRKLSHDIRSPLTSILGLAEITLEDPSLSEDSRENIKMIVSDAERLTEMALDAVADIEKRLHVDTGAGE